MKSIDTQMSDFMERLNEVGLSVVDGKVIDKWSDGQKFNFGIAAYQSQYDSINAQLILAQRACNY